MTPHNEPEPVPKGSGFCQRMSEKLSRLIEEWWEDPRSAYGAEAILALDQGLDVSQPADARESGGMADTLSKS